MQKKGGKHPKQTDTLPVENCEANSDIRCMDGIVSGSLKRSASEENSPVNI